MRKTYHLIDVDKGQITYTARISIPPEEQDDPPDILNSESGRFPYSIGSNQCVVSASYYRYLKSRFDKSTDKDKIFLP